MRTALVKTLIFSVVILSACLSYVAQTDGQIAPPGKVFAGETLKYEGKFNKLKISFSVAELTFTSALAPNGTDLIIKGDAASKGTLVKIARFSFLQQYQSVIDLNPFRILKTNKHDVQKDRVRDGEAIFDYGQKRVTYVETDPKDRNRPPRRIATEIGNEVQDITSSIYWLRLQTLAVGKRLEVAISDSGIVYKVPVAVTAREQINSIFGKVWCFRVEPEVFGTGQLIEQKGKMVIWVTDDERRIPIRAQITASVGKIDIKLKSATKAR